MYNITLISTRHAELGKCNSNELFGILEKIRPEVIFLEAFETEYTKYDHYCFKSSEVYHKRLEINAIQKYSQHYPVEYIPVLDTELSDEFYEKIRIITEHTECEKLLDNQMSLVIENGFPFLNSEKNIQSHEEIRELGKRILDNNEICQKADASIDAYENSMLRNIYAYCKANSFNKAIFMCGAAHRKSIIEKIPKYEAQENIKLNWIFDIPACADL